MFRRRWSGLPDDPDFPADLEKLGYFLNEDDEIRSIANPKFYFNYFLSKSTRHNDRQRFAFTLAVQELIHTRLTSPPFSLTKLRLPLGNPATTPHNHIFVSADLRLKQRVIVLFGERDQDLGILAHRVVGGKGGVDAGSAAGLVKALLLQQGDKDDGNVGVVLANTGESFWWPEGGRALSYRQSGGVRMKSAVHNGQYFDALVNGVPGSADVDEHVATVMETVLDNTEFVGDGARIQIIGVSDGAMAVEKYLDANWASWKDRVASLAILGCGLDQGDVKDEGFRTFLMEKARAYITCTEPLDTPMANPGGNPFAHYNTTLGCPVLSSGETYHTEITLVKAQPAVLAWMAGVWAADRGRAYRNALLEVTFRSAEFEESLEFRDQTAFEGFPARLPPPRNVLGIKEDSDDEEEARKEEGQSEGVDGEAKTVEEQTGEAKRQWDEARERIEAQSKEAEEAVMKHLEANKHKENKQKEAGGPATERQLGACKNQMAGDAAIPELEANKPDVAVNAVIKQLEVIKPDEEVADAVDASKKKAASDVLGENEKAYI